MRMTRGFIIVGVLAMLPACREPQGERASMPKVAAEERARQQELARDEQRFIATLRRTKTLAEHGAPSVLYEVANPFDSNYDASKGRARVAQYPILRTIHPPEEKAAALIATLTDRSSYFPPGQIWTCLFEPHHVLVLGAGRERITAVVCIKCGDVDWIAGGQSIGVHSLTPEANRSLIELLDGRRAP